MLICNGRPLKMLSTIKGDVTGAVSAATRTLPMLIGYSITAFAVLGSDFVPQAAVIGLIAAIFSGFFTASVPWRNGSPCRIQRRRNGDG
jgi:MFS superfamily sulfate permease-like transporter